MAQDDNHRTMEFRDYLVVLRRRKLTLAATLIAIVAAAMAWSLTESKVYAATSEVLLQARTSEQIFAPNTPQYYDYQISRVQTEIKVMQSRSISEAVIEKIGHPISVSISQVRDTDVVAITAESPDPEEAAEIATSYAETYISVRRQLLVQDLLSAASEIQNKIDDLQREIDRLSDDPDDSRRSALEAQQTSYIQQFDQLQLASNLTLTGGAQLVSEAGVPTTPVRPRPKRYLVVGVVLGSLFGAALAFLREYLDDSLKSKEDLERAVDGLEVIGLVPAVPGWRDSGSAHLISLTQPSSTVAEAYRGLRTSVQFLGVDREMGIVQLTSPSASEGKTTTLANLAVALARAGQSVTIVCCDLRRPRLHEFFDLSNNVGFTSVLVGDVPLEQAIQRVPNVESVSLLASGPIPPNPSELLSSHRAREVFRALRGSADLVLVDSPPVLPVSDALVIAGMSDATVLVASARKTTRRSVHRAVELLRQVDAPLVGAVLNGVDPQGDGYGYGYGYTADDQKGSRAAARSAR